MTDHIDSFVNAMDAMGCVPASAADIKDGAENKLIRAADDGKGKKTLYYTFHIEGDRASGRWYSCKLNAGDSWRSKSDRKWTAEEKKAWKAKRDADRAASEKELQDGYDSIAAEAAALWKKSPKAKDHKYLKKKGISGKGLRVHEGGLLIPLKDSSGKLWSLQTILEDGTKFNSFLLPGGKWARGGKKQGCYHSIVKKGASLDVICICEGYATGRTISEATGLVVVVALDTGNLKPVAQAIREKYPDAIIAVCSDNDQWTIKQPRPQKLKDTKAGEVAGNDDCWSEWRDADLLFNPGREKAGQAAVAVNGFSIYPDIPADDKDKRTDYNDLAASDGLDAVKARIMPVIKAAQTPTEMIDAAPGDEMPAYALERVPDHIIYEQYQDSQIDVWNPVPKQWDTLTEDKYSGANEYGRPNWYDLIVWKEKPKGKDGGGGKPERDSGKNTQIFIERLYSGIFRLNNFSDHIFVHRCPPWEKDSTFKVRPIIDTDVYNMAAELETHGLGFNTSRVKGAIETVAKNHQFHPVQEYFDSLQWDGVPRLGTWLQTYCGADSQDSTYLSTIGTMWLVAAVRRIFEPGTKFDHMLVLEGKTSIGKSGVFRILSTFGRDIEESYFCESVSMNDIDKPHALVILQGKLMVEFAELDGMDKITDNALKRWITKQVDEIVKKYSNYQTKYPRQFVLGGSTNDDVWLRDSTGNRRYWPVKCVSVDTVGLKHDREQLWAEAVRLHKDGYKIHLADDDPVYKLAQVEQHKRLATDSWEDAIVNVVRDANFITYSEITKQLGFDLQRTNNVDLKRIGIVMRDQGWSYGQFFSHTGHKRRGFLNPKFKKKEKTPEPEREIKI